MVSPPPRLSLTLLVLAFGMLAACGRSGSGAPGAPADGFGQTTAAIDNKFDVFAGYNNSTHVNSKQAAAATACRIYTGTWCTCVLVARDLVLTAAHCTDGRDVADFEIGFPRRSSDPWPGVTDSAGNLYTFQVDLDGKAQTTGDVVDFKWAGNAHREWFSAYYKFERPAYTSSEVDGADVALIYLTEEVPADVVTLAAPVYLGNVGKAIERRSTPDPLNLPAAIGVGRGGGNPLRIGPPGRIWTKWDKCQWDEAPGWCPNTCQIKPEIRAESNVNRTDIALFEDGDSGGPLFVYNQSAERYEVVGVNSGKRNCPDPDVQQWAHIGRLLGDTDEGISDVIRYALGLDPDGDGRPDGSDLCPDDFDPGQDDDEGDGAGDACDNCRVGKECAGSSWASCYNPSQADFDGDGIGDLCDLCPEHPSGSSYTGRQRDDDGDGVGNECDLAPGDHIPYLACSDDAFCAANFAGFCVKEDFAPTGHCSRQTDEDGDGVEDSIDLCVGGIDPLNLNSNTVAEELRGVEAKGDICDEVPLFRLLGQGNATTDSVRAPDAAPEYWTSREAIFAQPVYGAPSGPDLNAQVAFRHCSCFDQPTGNTAFANDDDCGRFACDTDEAEDLGANWRPITIEDPQTQQPLSPPDRFGPTPFIPGIVGGVHSFAWNWMQDPLETRMVHRPYPAMDFVETTNGLVATVVTNRVVNAVTDRDKDQQLRVSTQRYVTTPPYPDRDELVFGVPEWLRCLGSPGCNLWVWDWWRDIVNPADTRMGDPVTLIADSLADSLAILDPQGGLTAIQTEADLVEWVASEAKIAWIPPSDSPPLLSSYGVQTQSVGVSLDEPLEPLIVVRAGASLELAEPVAGVAGGTPARVPLQLESGVTALYSALENRLLLVGADSEFRDFLQVYDLEEGNWDSPDWAPDLTPQLDLLAAAYDSREQTLYILQVDQGESSQLVRLVSHDLRRRLSTIRWEAPWFDLGTEHALVVQSDRTLALIESSTEGGHTVCHFDGETFVGAAKGAGALLGLPMPSRSGVGFLVSDNGEQTRSVLVQSGQRDPEAQCL